MICEIAIPCYNESLRLPSFLGELAHELSCQTFEGKITVVDDGSDKEDVKQLLASIAPIIERYPQLFQPTICLSKNIGKGGAVYAAWKSSLSRECDYVGFLDADGSTSAQEFCRLANHAIETREVCDGVIGSRVKMLGKTIVRDFHRHLIGRCFATMASELLLIDAYDTQCGAKVIKREVFQALEPRLQETGFTFDVELILLAMKSGFVVQEFPISWKDVKGSKVRMFRDVVRMALSLIKIRRRHGCLTNK
jgi:glycosyltransferase involved in cell wall biosynthesis